MKRLYTLLIACLFSPQALSVEVNPRDLIQQAMEDSEAMLVKDVIEARIELGESYREQEDYPAAAAQFALADSLLEGKNFPWLQMRLRGHQAQVFRSQGEPRRALDQFLEILRPIDKVEMTCVDHQ